MTTKPFKRLLLTGAAGNLGKVLRPRLRAHCEVLRLSDLGPLGSLEAGEEGQSVDLADKAAVHALLEGVDAVLHFGGVSTEFAFETVLPANIVGVFHLYEAARLQGVRRIVFASSNHVTGHHEQGHVITPQDTVRPDGYYGVSKAFGENLAQFYWDRHGIETVSLRIGSCGPEPTDRRGLSTWLSFDDLERLVVAALNAKDVGHSIVYGASANRDLWWDNTGSAVDYRPQDSAEPWRARIEQSQPAPDPINKPQDRAQGGGYVLLGPFD